MKYWLLTSEYPPYYGGGISTYCFHTTQMLAQYGHHVTVFVPDSTLISEQEITEDNHIRIVRFKEGSRGESQVLGREARLSFDIADVVRDMIRREGPPDIIESQEYLGLAYFLLQRKWTLEPELAGVPIVLTLHTPQYLCDHYNRGREYLLHLYWSGEMERFTLRAADALLSPSRFLMDELEKRGELGNVPCSVVANPYQNGNKTSGDLSLPSPVPAGPQEQTELFFVGKLEPRKGVFAVLRNMQDLWDKGSAWKLAMIGGDHYYSPRDLWMSNLIHLKYREYIERGLLSLESAIPPSELQARLQNATAVLFPSTFECFGYVAVESMALGLPVLASKSGGHAEIIQDGISGFLFDHGDPRSFADQLASMVRMDGEARVALGTAARTRVWEFCSYETVYAQKMAALEQALHARQDHRIFPFIRGPQVVEPENHQSGEQKDLLSIVIPYYNAGEYLPEALASIEKTTWQPREVIVVDDGSNDPDSIAVLQRISPNAGLRIVHKEKNEGLARARNTGALEARGEFLTFLDADDTIEPEFYSRSIDNLKTYSNIGFIGCWSRYWGNSSGCWPAWNPEFPYLLVHNMVVSGSLVLRRNAFIRFGLNDPQFEFGWEDYESVIRMVEHGCRGIVIPEAWFNYRIRPDSMVHQIGRNGQIFLSNLIITKHRETFLQYGTEVAALLATNGPGYLYDNPTIHLPDVGYLPIPGNSSGGAQTGAKEFPPAPARVYLYLAFRQALIKLYAMLGGDRAPILHQLKRAVKSATFRKPDDPG